MFEFHECLERLQSSKYTTFRAAKDLPDFIKES